MIYATRHAQGHIVSLHKEPVPGAEALPFTHPDVQQFLGEDREQRQFASLDAGLVRVLEDLIDALIRRNVICITDLPMEAQLKLFDRKHFREGVRDHALDLYDGSPQARAEVMAATTDWADSRHG
ncbi:MAG: hypothetical protein RI907_1816 [Pseudomonadota bacterium]|jgi:hypothetical protein